MNITFFIGNGFDLNLGLKTDYKSFLEYHKSKNYDDMLSKNINQDITAWADLERALGAFTKNITSEDIDSFIESKCLLDESLSDYLLHIDTTNEILFGDKGHSEFRDRLISFAKEFSEVDTMHYNEIIRSTNEAIHYCFVSFNYTSFLDRIIDKAKNINPFCTHKTPNGTINDCIDLPIHVHGKIGHNVLLGVNDLSQLEAADDVKKALAPYMLKPDMNTALGQRNITHVKTCINASQYIIVYGMSIGATDLMWWSSLCEWLKGNKSRRLILYIYHPKITLSSASRTLLFQNKERKQFIRMAQYKTADIQEQIIVIPNSRTFSYNTIHVRETQNNERAEAV